MMFVRPLSLIGVLVFLGVPAVRSQTFTTINESERLKSLGFEQVSDNKYAIVVNKFGTHNDAFKACRAILPGATFFVVNDANDSSWLGKRINFEKDRVSGASKFWVGLVSRGAGGPLGWSDGSSYVRYPEVVQESGFDDGSKRFAWAVPDGRNKLKYEFLTRSDKAEAFICQYLV